MDSQPNMNVKINRDSLSEYLRRRYPDRQIVFDKCPYMLDELIAELYIRRFDTIEQVHETLARTEKAAELFEKDNPPDTGLANSRYSAIGIVRMSILLLDEDFFTFGGTIFDDGNLCETLEGYKKYILPEDREN